MRRAGGEGGEMGVRVREEDMKEEGSEGEKERGEE